MGAMIDHSTAMIISLMEGIVALPHMSIQAVVLEASLDSLVYLVIQASMGIGV